MKYELSWTQKDGTKVTGQIYTTENVMSILKNLEEWGATDIVMKSNIGNDDARKYDVVLTMINSRMADAKRCIEKNKEYMLAELNHDRPNANELCNYTEKIREMQKKISLLEEEIEHIEFLRDYKAPDLRD